MKSKNRVFFLCVCISFVLVLMWFSGRGEAIDKSIEAETWITVPEYRSDAARAIDAYERMMERYMDVTREDLGGLRGGIKMLSRKLSSVERKLNRIDRRLLRIERAVGIKPQDRTTPPAGKKRTKKPNSGGTKESKKD